LPRFKEIRLDQPLTLELWIRLQTDLSAFADQLQSLIEELNKRQTKLYLLEAFEQIQKEAAVLARRHEDLKRRHQDLETTRAELQNSNLELLEERRGLQAAMAGILDSRSWRLTKPLRKVTESLRSSWT
jgi:hypothetical protein